jgi:hypothetical protein
MEMAQLAFISQEARVILLLSQTLPEANRPRPKGRFIRLVSQRVYILPAIPNPKSEIRLFSSRSETSNASNKRNWTADCGFRGGGGHQKWKPACCMNGNGTVGIHQPGIPSNSFVTPNSAGSQPPAAKRPLHKIGFPRGPYPSRNPQSEVRNPSCYGIAVKLFLPCRASLFPQSFPPRPAISA